MMDTEAKKWSASRPDIPPAYGISKNKKGILPWSHVDDRMAQAKVYWVCTVDPEGHPHATPVDGVWNDGRLYFSGDPRTKRQRNLAGNPNVCIHLENGYDVLILHGVAQELKSMDFQKAERLASESKVKYGYSNKPEDYQSGGVWEFTPELVFAWTEFLKDATRWKIAS